jgi:hypothetical protein
MKKFFLFMFACLTFTMSEVAYAAETPLETTLGELREYVARQIDARSGAPLTDDEMRVAIRDGVEWLKRAQQSSGRFRYEFSPYADTYSSDDNIVRQTGALYALGEVLAHDTHDPYRVAHTAERAILHFAKISKSGEFAGTEFRCVTVNSASTKCELGATALALIGILRYVEEVPENSSSYRGLIDDYRAFILAMQKENGGFRNTFLIGRTKQSDTESPFSNGEALLALTRLYNYKSDGVVKDAIEASLAHLTKEPYDTALYLWIMAAMKEVDAIDVRLQNFSYVRDFTLWRIERGQSTRATNKNFCAYTEGIVSALSVLKDRVPSDVYDRILREAEYGLRKNRALQLTANDATRAFVDTNGLSILTATRSLRAEGGFLTGENERTQRIDYTQHCVSAYLQMLGDVRGKRITTE